MSDTPELPPGYQIEKHSPRIWYASKTDAIGLTHMLLNERRVVKAFRSDVRAAAYCRGHARQGLEAHQVVQQKRGDE